MQELRELYEEIAGNKWLSRFMVTATGTIALLLVYIIATR